MSQNSFVLLLNWTESDSAMVSLGLGRGLDTLLAESAQLRTRSNAASRSLGGVKLLLHGDGKAIDFPNAIPLAKHIDREAIRNKYVLLSIDVVLLFIAIWIHTVSRSLNWSGGLIISYSLVGIACILGFLAIQTHPRRH